MAPDGTTVFKGTGSAEDSPLAAERRVVGARTVGESRRTPMPLGPAGLQQQFDEAGFPIPQRMPGFRERVRRLLGV